MCPPACRSRSRKQESKLRAEVPIFFSNGGLIAVRCGVVESRDGLGWDGPDFSRATFPGRHGLRGRHSCRNCRAGDSRGGCRKPGLRRWSPGSPARSRGTRATASCSSASSTAEPMPRRLGFAYIRLISATPGSSGIGRIAPHPTASSPSRASRKTEPGSSGSQPAKEPRPSCPKRRSSSAESASISGTAAGSSGVPRTIVSPSR